MRPLIVLLLVLVAAGALVFALGLFDSGTDTTDVAGPAAVVQEPSGQEPASGAQGPALVGVADASGRDAAAAPVSALPTGDEIPLQSPGQGNRLIGTVRDDAGQAVEGARVKLSRDPQMGDALALQFFVNRPRSGKSVSAVTGPDGGYAFKDVAPANDYYLVASHEEYSPVQESLVFVGEQGEFHGPDVVLRSGARLSGTVVDVSGGPVPDAKLFLDSAYNMTWDQPNPDRLETETDAVGYYEFRNVPAGPRNLMVQAPGYGSQVMQSGALQFKGEPGEEKTIDLTLEVGHPIVGQVVGPEGVGVPGAKVIAVNFQNQITSRGEAVSDEGGRFQIDDLRSGSYIMMVLAKGYSQARMNRVQAGKVDVLIELKRQACVSGRVVAQGAPVGSFTVEVRRTSPNPTPGVAQLFENYNDLRENVQDSDGGFQLCGLEGGFYAVMVFAEGYAPTQSAVFQVVDNQHPQPLTIALSAGGRIAGRVVDSSGAPVASALVRSGDSAMPDLSDDPIFGSLFASVATDRRTRTNVEGYFELGSLTPATYRISVEHPRFAGDLLKDIVVAENQTAQIGNMTLRAGGTVRGVLLDQLGQSLPRGFVQLVSTTDPGLQYRTRTDAEGRYEFLHVRPGSFKLSATRSAPGSTSDPFQSILDQQASEVTVSVGDGATLSRDLALGG